MDALQVFNEEAREHLDALEAALLELENEPTGIEHIDTAFRAMHTIKGSAGMVGLDHVSEFTHHLENCFDMVRKGEIELTTELITFVLDARDHIKALIHEPDKHALSEVSEQMLATLRSFIPENVTEETKVSEKSSPSRKREDETAPGYWRVTMEPHGNTFHEGLDCLPILRDLQELGGATVSCEFAPIDNPEDFDPEKSYYRFVVLLEKTIARNDIENVFIFVSADWTYSIEAEVLTEEDRLGDLLVESGVISSEMLDDFSNQKPKIGEELARAGMVEPRQVKSALNQQQFIRSQKPPEVQSQNRIKVPAEKLDRLMNLVGELVIVQSGLMELAQDTGIEKLQANAEELDRLSNELRETTFNIRMLPIGSTFSRFRRLIRDLGRDLGKEVRLETSGADTELDKVVLEKLVDPLVHILRNSMDHGIESPEDRKQAGKPGQGLIRLEASHNEGQIRIRISDDGCGLDKQGILKKARDKGLIHDDDNLSDEEIYRLIFHAGFSTASEVSDVSGRGVGMDVVKTSIEDLQGRIKIKSEVGVGTELSIFLPMTLAIVDGLMVRVARERFIIPLDVVEECVESLASETTSSDGARVVRSRGELIPTVRVRELFKLQGYQPEIEQTIITRIGDDLLGFTVDEVVGQHQTVIKNLGRLYRHTTGLLGATILGDGEVAMILDVARLYEDSKQTALI